MWPHKSLPRPFNPVANKGLAPGAPAFIDPVQNDIN